MPSVTPTYRPVVQRMTRSQLEDAYFRLHDDNRDLKQKLSDNEKKLKLSTAKLLKAMSGRSEHSIDLDEMESKLSNVEKENWLLKNKLKSARHQLATLGATGTRRRPASQSTTSREPATPLPSKQRPQQRPIEHEPDWHPQSAIRPNQQQPSSMTIADTGKLKTMQSQIDHLNRQLSNAERQIRSLQNQLDNREQSFDRLRTEYNKLAHSTTLKENQINHYDNDFMKNSSHEFHTTKEIHVTRTEMQGVSLEEANRLQSQLREKMMEMAEAETKMAQMDLSLRSLKSQHDMLLAEFTAVNEQFKTERQRSQSLQQQITNASQSNGQTSQQNGQINAEVQSLQRELQSLREANEKLMQNAFNLSREQQWFESERQLRGKINELEQTVRADVDMRNELLEKVAAEISSKEQAEDALRKQEITMLQLKTDHERMDKRMKALTQGGFTWSDIEAAVAMLRQGKQAETRLSGKMPDFLTPVNDAAESTANELDRLKAAYAATVAEMDKTRAMLLVQHNINADYQAQLDVVSRKAQFQKSEFERELKRYAELLDQRAMRIQRLENSLHEIAYGRRKQSKMPASKGVSSEQLRDHRVQLEAGQNLLEIKLTKAHITTPGIKWMQSDTPSFFLTIEFFDFEIQFTPIITGASVTLNFTCEYAVLMSDLLLHYMDTDSVTIELHQATGTNYKTWAAGSLYLRDLLRSTDGMQFASVDLIGVSSEATGVMMARLDVAACMQLPIESTIVAYKERALALGYLLDDDTKPSTDGQVVSNTNQMIVTLHRCRDLKSNFGPDHNVSAYVVYSVFDLPEQDTKIVASNNSPQWNDTREWTLPVGVELNEYIKTQYLKLLVFDDTADTNETALIGTASIPLVPLAHNKIIKGAFQVSAGASSESRGSVEVSIEWKYTYIPPKDDLIVAQMMVDLGNDDAADLGQEEVPESPHSSLPQPSRRALPKVVPSQMFGSQNIATSDPVKTETVSGQPEPHPPPNPLIRRDSYTKDEPSQPNVPVVNQLSAPKDPAPSILYGGPSFDSSVDSVQAQILSSIAQQATGDVQLASDLEEIPDMSQPPDEPTDFPDEYPKPNPLTSLPKLPNLAANMPVNQAKPTIASILSKKPPDDFAKAQVPLEPVITVANGAAEVPVAAPRRKSKTVEFNEEPQIFDLHPPPGSFDDDDSMEDGDTGEHGTDEAESEEPVQHSKDANSVNLSIGTLTLNQDSPLLDRTFDDEQICVQWIFLDLSEQDCQTDLSLYLPRDAVETVDFQFSKDIRLNSEQLVALKKMVQTGEKMRFEILRDPVDQNGMCEELASAHLDLQAVYNSDGDVHTQQLQCCP